MACRLRAESGMRTLLGVFRSSERGREAAERLKHAGYAVWTTDDPSTAAEVTRADAKEHVQAPGRTAASGAVVAGLASGGLGAIPGAVLGKLAGGWLSE